MGHIADLWVCEYKLLFHPPTEQFVHPLAVNCPLLQQRNNYFTNSNLRQGFAYLQVSFQCCRTVWDKQLFV